jgi:hypothetical protein
MSFKCAKDRKLIKQGPSSHGVPHQLGRWGSPFPLNPPSPRGNFLPFFSSNPRSPHITSRRSSLAVAGASRPGTLPEWSSSSSTPLWFSAGLVDRQIRQPGDLSAERSRRLQSPQPEPTCLHWPIAPPPPMGRFGWLRHASRFLAPRSGEVRRASSHLLPCPFPPPVWVLGSARLPLVYSVWGFACRWPCRSAHGFSWTHVISVSILCDLFDPLLVWVWEKFCSFWWKSTIKNLYNLVIWWAWGKMIQLITSYKPFILQAIDLLIAFVQCIFSFICFIATGFYYLNNCRFIFKLH